DVGKESNRRCNTVGRGLKNFRTYRGICWSWWPLTKTINNSPRAKRAHPVAGPSHKPISHAPIARTRRVLWVLFIWVIYVRCQVKAVLQSDNLHHVQFLCVGHGRSEPALYVAVEYEHRRFF